MARPSLGSGVLSLHILSLAFALPLLLYASWWDIRQRGVSNLPWLVMVGGGGLLLAYRTAAAGPPVLLQLAYSLALTAGAGYALFRLGLMGGADAKALMALSVLFPVQPDLVMVGYRFPLLPSPPAFPFALTILLDGAFLSLTVPLSLLLYNLFTLGPGPVRREPGAALLGYKLDIEAITSRKHLRLLHHYEEGEGDLRRRFSLGGAEIEEGVVAGLRGYRRRGQIESRVWVSPHLPFLAFITAGFLLAAVVGNPAFPLLSLIGPR
ncbi:MAG: A24 family peptidase C-terminal domain-containing protein [Dehalococcoidia bacterium]